MEDKYLWNNLRKGDKNALQTIYQAFFEDLYSYGLKFTSDKSTVEDCIQELFIELWNKRENLSETDNIKPYLYVSIRRKIIAQLKKNRNSGIELNENQFNVELNTEQLMITNEKTEEQKILLQNAIMQLSDRQKEIIYLKFYAQLDYDAITEIMDMNYQSARNLVSRAIVKLSKVVSMKCILFYLFFIN